MGLFAKMKMVWVANRVCLIGFIVWTIILVVGLTVEIVQHELIFEDYLSGAFGWMLILALLCQVTRDRGTRGSGAGNDSGDGVHAADR